MELTLQMGGFHELTTEEESLVNGGGEGMRAIGVQMMIVAPTLAAIPVPGAQLGGLACGLFGAMFFAINM